MAFAADVFREPLANPSEALGDAVRKDVGEGFCKPFGEAFRESFCVSLAKPLFGVCHCYSTWHPTLAGTACFFGFDLCLRTGYSTLEGLPFLSCWMSVFALHGAHNLRGCLRVSCLRR